MRIPPTVGTRPRWDQGSEPEFIYLSQEGYPLHARRSVKSLQHSSPIRHLPDDTVSSVRTSLADPNVISSPFQRKINNYAYSSSGILMREFNRPFPRFPHRVSEQRYNLISTADSEPFIRTQPAIERWTDRERVPGMLWPVPSTYVGTPLVLKTLTRAREILESSKVNTLACITSDYAILVTLRKILLTHMEREKPTPLGTEIDRKCCLELIHLDSARFPPASLLAHPLAGRLSLRPPQPGPIDAAATTITRQPQDFRPRCRARSRLLRRSSAVER